MNHLEMVLQTRLGIVNFVALFAVEFLTLVFDLNVLIYFLETLTAYWTQFLLTVDSAHVLPHVSHSLETNSAAFL